MSASVPRIGRLLDAVGLVLFFAGAGVYGWAWTGLRRLRESPPASMGGEFAAVGRANDLTTLSRIGLGLMAGAVVVAVVAAVVARRGRGEGE